MSNYTTDRNRRPAGRKPVKKSGRPENRRPKKKRLDEFGYEIEKEKKGTAGKVIPALIAIVLIIVVVYVGFGQQIIDKYSYSQEKYDMNVYFENKSDSDVAIILGDKFLEDRAYLYDGTYYVDFEFARENLCDWFYFDEVEKLLIYVLPTQILVSPVDSSKVTDTVTGDTSDMGYKVTRMEGDKLIIALDYVKEYSNFEYIAFTDPGRIQMYVEWGDITTAQVKKDTQVRHRGGVKEEILKELKVGDKVTVIEQMEEWSKVKTDDAIIGFVENKRLESTMVERQVPVTSFTEPEYPNLCRDHMINMVWHNVAGTAGNDTFDSYIAPTKGINVISPTWFGLTDSDGNYDNFSQESYVEKAHSKDMEVWPTFNNVNNDSHPDLDALFSSTSKRTDLISRLVTDVLACGADGINVDIEMLPLEAGRDFAEFIRELSVSCRLNNLVLSVDNYVPLGNTDYYDRKTQGKVADYVVIMGYDEHYGGSQEAGSVASIGFVQTGIENTLAVVPASKVINAVPLYTRLWEIDGAKISSSAYPMANAKEWVDIHNVTLTWDDETCQNYGETTIDGKEYKIWMEDAESLSAKLSVMKNKNIAGVAEWCLNYDTPEVWDVIGEYLGN